MKKINSIKKSVFIGIPSKVNKEVVDEETGKNLEINLATLAMVHEFGSPKMNIPERSFLKIPLINNKADLNEFVKDGLKKFIKGEISEDDFLGLIGEKATDISLSAIESGQIKPELKPNTIKRKKSSLPLIDTGVLSNSITWEIK